MEATLSHPSPFASVWTRLKTLSHHLWCPLLMVYVVLIGGTFWGALNGSVKIFNQCLTLLLVAVFITHHVSRFTLHASRFTLHALFALCWLLSTWQSVYPRLALEGCFQQLWYLLLFFLACAYTQRKQGASTLASGFLIATSALVLCGVWQYVNWWLDPQRDLSAGGQRVMRATLNSHNDFAGYLTLLLPLSWHAALEAENGGGRILIHRGRTVLMLFCLVLTYSRAGWLGGIVAVAVSFALSSFQRPHVHTSTRPHVSFLCCCLVAIVAACYATPQRMAAQRITGALTQPASDMGISGRRIIYRNTLEIIAQRPLLGWGASAFPLVYPQFTQQNEQRELAFHAHNLFLQYAAEAGVFAALIFVAMVAFTLKRAWSKSSASHPLKTPLTAGIIGYLVYSLFNSCAAIPAIHATFWMMLGILAGASAHRRIGTSGRSHWLPCAFCLLFTPFVIKTNLAQTTFETALQTNNPLPHLQRAVALDPQNAFYHAQLALALSREERLLTKAIAHYRRAVQLMPYDALHHHNLGWCYVRLKQHDQAASHFRKAVACDKSQPLYRLSLGYALQQNGLDDEALRTYETASRLWANAPMSHVLQARLLARRGQKGRAFKAYQSALDALRSGRPTSGCHIPVRYRRVGFQDEVIQPKEWNVSEKDVLKEWESLKGSQ
jgi:O-antigen ligase/Flp pilus assembly protein TadD